MKLISNYKDYYDFIQGLHGIDPLITYERHFQSINSVHNSVKGKWEKISLNHQPKLNHLDTYFFAICGQLYFVANINEAFYFGNDAYIELKKIKGDVTSIRMLFDTDLRHFERLSKRHLEATSINDNENCPILIINSKNQAIVKNPRLSDFNFHKIIDPQTLFISIAQFLTRQAVIEDKRSDVEKLQAFGFDKITSFRNM